MAGSKRSAKKPIKDLKPKKSAAQRIKGGHTVPPNPLKTVMDKVNQRVPDPM